MGFYYEKDLRIAELERENVQLKEALGAIEEFVVEERRRALRDTAPIESPRCTCEVITDEGNGQEGHSTGCPTLARAALREEGADIADAARTKALWESRTDSTGSDKGFVKIDSVALREEGK
jgi:hypothetical protein